MTVSDLTIAFVACTLRVPRRPIIDTDIGFFHVPTHSDASRKRIIEDTEDWRPRSGTSQSRSFRILAQITGTENGESPAVQSPFYARAAHPSRWCSGIQR